MYSQGRYQLIKILGIASLGENYILRVFGVIKDKPKEITTNQIEPEDSDDQVSDNVGTSV